MHHSREAWKEPVSSRSGSSQGRRSLGLFAVDLVEFGDVDALVSVPAYNRRASFLDYDGEVFDGILKLQERIMLKRVFLKQPDQVKSGFKI